MSDKNKDTARRFVLGIGLSDLPGELFAPDFTGWSGLSGDIPGDIFRERTLMMGELFPQGLVFTIYETIAEGPYVSLRCSSKGTLFNDVDYANDYHYHFCFDEEGRIRRVMEYMNVSVAAEVVIPAFAEFRRRREAVA